MINLQRNTLELRFPEIHENAGVRIDFQRTIRVPDDGNEHFLPPGLGNFPVRHIEDYDLSKAEELKKRGGVILPMFQADALWLNFSPLVASSRGSWNDDIDETYPIALKIGTGKICAVSGLPWSGTLNRDPQDYVIIPEQDWLDGYNVDKNNVRQFVAAPLGKGYTVEEQLTGSASVGGIQIQAFPMKLEKYNEYIAEQKRIAEQKKLRESMVFESRELLHASAEPDFMGLAPGGKIKQEIMEDTRDFSDWDLRNSTRCFVTLANASQWMALTGEEPPISPLNAKDYTQSGGVWFDYYEDDSKAIEGAKALGKIKSAPQMSKEVRDDVWPEDKSLVDHILSVKKIKKNLGSKIIPDSGEW